MEPELTTGVDTFLDDPFGDDTTTDEHSHTHGTNSQNAPSHRPIIIHPTEKSYSGTSHQAKQLQWHYRTGHINWRYLKRVAKRIPGMEEILNIPHNLKMPQCHSCQMARSRHQPLPKGQNRRCTEAFFKLHSDMSGKIAISSLDGAHYFVVFVDDASYYKFVYMLKTKDGWLDALDKLFIRTGKTCKILRTDNAGEIVGERAKEFYQQFRIWHEKCCAHQHWQNPRAEGAIGSLSARARVMMHYCGCNKGRLKRYWSFAVFYACEIENRFLPHKTGSDVTCHEAFYGEAPDNTVVKTFGCTAYLHIPRDRRYGKWSDTSVEGIFLGFANHLGHKGYIIGSLDGRRLYIAQLNVTFNEGKFPYRPDTPNPSHENNPSKDQVIITTPYGNTLEEFTDIDDESHAMEKIVIETSDDVNTVEQPETEAQVRERLQRDAQPLSRDDIIEQQQQQINQSQQEDRRDRDRRNNINNVREHREYTGPVTRSRARQLGMYTSSTFTSFLSSSYTHPDDYPLHDPNSDTTEIIIDDSVRIVDDTETSKTHPENEYNTSNYTTFLEELRKRHHVPRDSLFEIACALSAYEDVPISLPDAKLRKDAKKWIECTTDEHNSLKEMNVYEVVDLPEGRQAIQTKIVYKLKLDEANNPLRYKARICAKGFQQQKGKDYFDSFAAMAHPTSIRLLIAMAVANNWFIKHADIKTAFLHAPLQEKIYVRPPDGLEEPGGKVWLLKKNLYGLFQAGFNFYKLLAKTLTAYKMEAITADETVFSLRRGKSILICACVVDDILIFGNDTKMLDEFMKYLRSHFNVPMVEDLKWYLGIKFERINSDLKATQTAYLDRCLERYKFMNLESKTLPMDPNFRVTENMITSNPDPEILKQYQQYVGSLIYLSIWTRPDIAYAVGILARYMSRPTQALVNAAIQVFRYLIGTKDKGLWFRQVDPDSLGDENRLVAYCPKAVAPKTLKSFTDSSDADCKLTYRSTGGYIIFYNGCPISWKSSRQTINTLSTTESEFVQASLTCQEIVYLREILHFLGDTQPPTMLFVDSKPALDLSENPCHRSRTRHIPRRFHYVRRCCTQGETLLVKIDGTTNVADIFTKPLSREHLTKYRTIILNETRPRSAPVLHEHALWVLSTDRQFRLEWVPMPRMPRGKCVVKGTLRERQGAMRP
mmetsp:Transcript_10215/g.20434  ORF Transcript_10215/g.20434 Transcript_10215/m.20434 type:complete len:1162 (-) Transcript_10215:305-3790(-)